MYSILRPWIPPAAFTSSNTICVPLTCGINSGDSGPVSATIVPILIVVGVMPSSAKTEGANAAEHRLSASTKGSGLRMDSLQLVANAKKTGRIDSHGDIDVRHSFDPVALQLIVVTENALRCVHLAAEVAVQQLGVSDQLGAGGG